MKNFAIIFSAFCVTACCQNVRPDEPITSHEVVKLKVPGEFLDIPPAPAALDLSGSQKDVALWLIENEKRLKTLETQILKIRQFNNE